MGNSSHVIVWGTGIMIYYISGKNHDVYLQY